MTRYIEWGTVSNLPGGLHRETLQKVDPIDLSTITALWAALPPDLRLALAKTCPKVAGKWVKDDGPRPVGERYERDSDEGLLAWVWGNLNCWCFGTRYGTTSDPFLTLAEAQSACDTALRAQGYVLDGDTP